jgi:hypothetical protein
LLAVLAEGEDEERRELEGGTEREWTLKKVGFRAGKKKNGPWLFEKRKTSQSPSPAKEKMVKIPLLENLKGR